MQYPGSQCLLQRTGCAAAHTVFAPASSDSHRKHSFNLRVSKYIWFFYHHVNEGKERTQKYIYIYLYSSQLYINLKNKSVLAGTREFWEGASPTAMAIGTVNSKPDSGPHTQL